jgi:signal transduction histidine kinase
VADGSDEVDTARAEVDLLRRRVLNVVGHELRTPITTLRGLAELLGTTPDEPAKTAAVRDAIQRSARRIEHLVDDALVALGVTTAMPVGTAQPTPVVAVIHEAWEAVGDGELDIEGTATALVHPDGFRRALACVLDNARKYGELVHVEVAERNGHAVVTVLDEGPGLTEGEGALLFEPFFRGERAVMTAPGLGLGLTVARRLLEHDGGTVEVGAGVGGGAAATVRVPRP